MPASSGVRDGGTGRLGRAGAATRATCGAEETIGHVLYKLCAATSPWSVHGGRPSAPPAFAHCTQLVWPTQCGQCRGMVRTVTPRSLRQATPPQTRCVPQNLRLPPPPQNSASQSKTSNTQGTGQPIPPIRPSRVTWARGTPSRPTSSIAVHRAARWGSTAASAARDGDASTPQTRRPLSRRQGFESCRVVSCCCAARLQRPATNGQPARASSPPAPPSAAAPSETASSAVPPRITQTRRGPRLVRPDLDLPVTPALSRDQAKTKTSSPRQCALCHADPGNTSSIMQQWQVGPVPEYVYSNSTHPPNDMHNHPYQADMARRNERMEFPYGAPQPNMGQQHHPTPVQPPMNVPQQPPNAPGGPQQQTPTQTPAQPSRQRKRPAPNAAPSPATGAPPPPVTPSQIQPPAPTPPAPQSAPPTQSQAPTEDVNVTPVSQPPAKKSRTNTPWTPQEELRLKQMRDAGNSWAEIAKTFPTRTEGSVKKHWYKDMHYAEFAEDESQALLNAIKEYENNKWKVIGQKVGKPAKISSATRRGGRWKHLRRHRLWVRTA
ncbi:Uncharacterized protein TCAP_00606 [Tolypocladium capitatum]|uniref:Uncharacterized protein n=1 Tax=Tolypocladium capitatum TaxID=45235 RepID=A0A2K3QPN5_9HYPO|nr:Uncharacterized protein TCAP_00606 [Tolypocladium capitatum]